MGATVHEGQGLLCPSLYTWPLGTEVYEQMSQSCGQSESRPYDTYLLAYCSRNKSQSRPCPAREKKPDLWCGSAIRYHTTTGPTVVQNRRHFTCSLMFEKSTISAEKAGWSRKASRWLAAHKLHIFHISTVTDVSCRDAVLELCVRLFRAAVSPDFILMDGKVGPHTRRAHLIDERL
ncbi:hypothetical protein TNCV_3876711 [Trichonephila clavipes]|uniref:Uncharacterized protein n=1 Tax=Trichonephila clavipes TaxID=2585209 RepID=A0A8X6VR65_TRICX|nr:hypothetical protein TNCV_3876711 [Trichonephila clavipes]